MTQRREKLLNERKASAPTGQTPEIASAPNPLAPRLIDPSAAVKCTGILKDEYKDTGIAAWFSDVAAVVTRSRAGTADRLTRGLSEEVSRHEGAYAPNELRAPVLGLVNPRLGVFEHNRGEVDVHEGPPSLLSRLRIFFIDATESNGGDRRSMGTHDNTHFHVTPTQADQELLARKTVRRDSVSSYRPIVATMRVCDPADLRYDESAGQSRQQQEIHARIVQLQVLAAKSANPADMGRVLAEAQKMIDKLPVSAGASTKVPPIDRVITTVAYAPFALEILGRLGPTDQGILREAYEAAMRGESSSEPKKKSIVGRLFGGK